MMHLRLSTLKHIGNSNPRLILRVYNIVFVFFKKKARMPGEFADFSPLVHSQEKKFQPTKEKIEIENKEA
jgi:hypothetical protein